MMSSFARRLLACISLTLLSLHQVAAHGQPLPEICTTKGSAPVMTPDEVRYFASLLTANTTLLEWGSGGSTRCFLDLVGAYYSIEHDKTWYGRIQRELGGHPKLKYQLSYVRKSLQGWLRASTPGSYQQFRTYVHAVDNFEGAGKFDVVLVDGRARVACAAYVLRYLHADSIVLVHDFYGPRNRNKTRNYGQVFRFYYEVHRVDSFVALRPKPEYLGEGAAAVDIPSLYPRDGRQPARSLPGAPRWSVSSTRKRFFGI